MNGRVVHSTIVGRRLAVAVAGLILAAGGIAGCAAPTDGQAARPGGKVAAPAAPAVVVVVGGSASEPENFAAEFLAARVGADLRKSGAPRLTEATGAATVILLGTPKSNPAMASLLAGMDPTRDGYVINREGNTIQLGGVNARSTIYAAAGLLRERGWRCYSLHDRGETPVDPRTDWPKRTIRETPKFAMRSLACNLPLGAIGPRYFDWMAANGLNRLVLSTGVAPAKEQAASLANQLARRGIELGWAERTHLEAEQVLDPLGPLWSGPRGPLGAINKDITASADGKQSGVIMNCPPQRFLLDEFHWAADYFAECAWSGPLAVEPWVRDFARRYYGEQAGPQAADYLLGLETMGDLLAKPDALLDGGTFTRWTALRQLFYDARTKAPANTDPRKRLAQMHKPVLAHYLTCAQADQAIRRAAQARIDPQERRRALLDAIAALWAINQQTQESLETFNRPSDHGAPAVPGADAYALGTPHDDPTVPLSSMLAEVKLLGQARDMLLAGETFGVGQIAPAGAPGQQPAAYCDGNPKTVAVMATADPGASFVLDLGKAVTVGRVRFLGGADRPITAFRILVQGPTGERTTVIQGVARAPGSFLPVECRFPPVQARRVILQVDRFERCFLEGSGPSLAELEAFEK